MNLIGRIVLAAVFGGIAFLVCIFVGGLLASTDLPPAAFIGKFLETWAWAIAVLVAVWYFFRGGFSIP